MTPTRLCLIPRWAGTPESDWYPWLKDELGQTLELLLPSMPAPDAPTLDAWPKKIAQCVGEDEEQRARTLLVGHSVGCQAVLRYLASLPRGSRVGGVLCVAGWWTVDAPWETLRPWIETPLDTSRVREASPCFLVLLSDNDPFTSDWQKNRNTWEERLGAWVRIVPGAKHFNQTREPEVLREILERG